MRKIIIALTLLTITALAISACSTATSVAPTATSGVPVTGPIATAVTGTPAAVQTTQATSAATIMATSQATTSATAAATAMATAAVTTAPTTAATTAATVAANSQPTAPVSAPTQTPFAGIPGQYVRLSILLQSTISTSLQVGQVTGVVIVQPLPSNGATNPTPTPDQLVPYVRYVVAHMNGTSGSPSQNSEVLIPWQVFAFTPGNASQNQAFTLKGSASTLLNAPEITLPADISTLASGWDSQVSQYWASQGFSVPVTGVSQNQPATQIVLRKTINGSNIIDNKNQVFGQMTDLLVDPSNGQFAYAVFNGGPAFSNRIFVVPVRNLLFFLGSASATNGLGNIKLNFPTDILNSAPFFNTQNIIPLHASDLNNLLNNFWQNVQNNSLR